jgi:hypothetical protein
VQWRTQSGPLCAVICGDDFLTSALAAAGKRAREGERERQTQTERPREREREREGGGGRGRGKGDADHASRVSPSAEEIQLNYRKGSGLKVDCRFIYGDCQGSAGVYFSTRRPPSRPLEGQRTLPSRSDCS